MYLRVKSLSVENQWIEQLFSGNSTVQFSKRFSKPTASNGSGTGRLKLIDDRLVLMVLVVCFKSYIFQTCCVSVRTEFYSLSRSSLRY